MKLSRKPQALALIALGTCTVSLIGWQARASLPRWMQDAIGNSDMEAALYRAMDIPSAKMLYPRPPKEASHELSVLINKTPQQAELYSLRALSEEQALDFKAAESDWKAYASRAQDSVSAKIELADYYHRRLEPQREAQVLLQVGVSPAVPREQYLPLTDQQYWKAFERLLVLAADQRMNDDVVADTYRAWIARYPEQSSVYAREFRWLLERKRWEAATALLTQYKRAFPNDAVFPVKAAALLEYRRGSSTEALKTYDRGFEPLWPSELVASYYSLLAETHNQRRFVAEARARLAQSPDDLNAMARLFYYAQQQGHLEEAAQITEAYRRSKEARKAAWTAQELYTLAQLTEAIHAYPEAARYNFALYHVQGSLANGISPQAEGLSSMIRILLTAPEQPVALGAGNLTMYRDAATLDRGPGYWNGILSLWLNTTSPDQAYHEEEDRARPYFHRAKAAELLALLDKQSPAAPARPALHKELIGVLAEYGENDLVIRAGNEFLSTFSVASEQANRYSVAMYMADADAQKNDSVGEFSLYERMLSELSGQAGGMPLTLASTISSPKTVLPPASGEPAASADETPPQSAPTTTRAFELETTEADSTAPQVAQMYRQLLERYLGRLTAKGQLPQALAVLRKQLDRNPNDPLLYERLADFLQQNNLSSQQEAVYTLAIQKFQDKSWYDKLARLYLREKKREAFADLTKQVTGIFHGTDLEEFFAQVNQGGPELFLQLNLYAHQRFPHNEVFVRNLLQAYQAKPTRNTAAWEKLLREHWSDSQSLRMEFFDYLSRNGQLDAELAQLHTLIPDAVHEQTNPAASREFAEIEMWRSHFEESAPLLSALAEAYPADEELGTQASSVFRSLAYFDTKHTQRAVAIEEHLLAAKPEDSARLARIGDIYSDSGADGAGGHEDIAAAAPYWRRMPAVHPGDANGYLQAATVFWDYFQFDDALAEIREARTKFGKPALFAYEAGAIYEGKRDLNAAIHEYVQAACSDEGSTPASSRLLQLARRKATAQKVDEETTHIVAAQSGIAALQLRDRILTAQKREAEIAPLLTAALAKTTTTEQAQAIGTEAQAHLLSDVYEHALEREIALANDPVQKIELYYELSRSLEDRKDIAAATRVIEQVYREDPKLMGVVRTTTDFYWRNDKQAQAITTLVKAADAAKGAQPMLSRQYTVEAANKANEAGSYTQARTLAVSLLDPTTASVAGADAYDPQAIALVANSYALAGDSASLKEFYLAELKSIHDSPSAMSTMERKQKTVLLQRSLIPAYTKIKDFAMATELYIAILSAYPEDTGATAEAVAFALRYGRQQQLSDFINATVKTSPRDSRFAIMQAQIETGFEAYPQAIDAYARAIAIRGDRADVFTAKAELEERLQRLDDACKEYERLYVLSYHNPDWMVKIAQARARQGRKEDVVKALQRAWIDGHPVRASDDFRVAKQLEDWNMLEQALRFAEMGVKAEGDELLAGASPGSHTGDDAQGAVIYARLMTRMRQQEKALATLDDARKAAATSPYSPVLVAEQVQKQGLASVGDSEWRKHRIEQRQQTAAQRYNSAVLEMAKTVSFYFEPEEKSLFASLIETRWKSMEHAAWPERSRWIDIAQAASLVDIEAAMRKQILLDRSIENGAAADAQFMPYVELQQSRMEFVELAQTLETYALQLKPEKRAAVRIAEENACRSAGDELAELRTLRKISFASNHRLELRVRYLKLLLKHDVRGFESYGVGSKDDANAMAAAEYSMAHGTLPVTRAAMHTHGTSFGPLWEPAYSALVGLYYRDNSATTEAAFHQTLGDEQTIGQRLQHGASAAVTGGGWFYYGMRYGVYRTLAAQTDWAQHDPEDYLAAGVERNPGGTSNYVELARAYTDAGRTEAALVEYRHALELAPDSPSIYDAIAMLLWHSHRNDEAVASWRLALAALNRVQNNGPAPESFWTGFALIAQHIGEYKLGAQLHSEMDSVLRTYIARNGNYRTLELLCSALRASESSKAGVDWILSLSTAAVNPADVLLEIEDAECLPHEEREPILLRELELDRIAAAHNDSGGGYMFDRVSRDKKKLALYYFAQKQDAKAEGLVEDMSATEQMDDDLVEAAVVSASRGKRLSALLADYRVNVESPTTKSPGPEVLRRAAGQLAMRGDNAGALAVWQYVFDRERTLNNAMPSDYLGLAEARIRTNDTAGAVTLLHSMTMLPGDVYANYDLAARLLEKNGLSGQAIPFLSALRKNVPWDDTYGVRLASAQLQADKANEAAIATLRAVTGNKANGYDLRARAALALHSAGPLQSGATQPGSDELSLLSLPVITTTQVERPYFAYARIVLADGTKNVVQQEKLLRAAISIKPGDAASAGSTTLENQNRGQDAFELSSYALKTRLFRTEAAAGRNATALNVLERLLNSSYAFNQPDAPDAENDEAVDAATDGAANVESGDAGLLAVDSDAGSRHNLALADLERAAPMPHDPPLASDDVRRIALALLIAQTYEHTDDNVSAVAYLRLAAYFEKDTKRHAELEQRIHSIDTALAVETRNAMRRPQLQRGLDQSVVVQPRLTVADLASEEAAHE